MVNKKRILLLCTPFFGYANEIAFSLQKNGFYVDLFDERPSSSFFCKMMVRLDVKVYHPVIHKYIKSIINTHIDADYSNIIVIKGEAIDKTSIALLRKAYPNAHFTYYLWDSIDNIKNGRVKIGLYDSVLSFDRSDAEKYNLKYRPTFYSTRCERTDCNSIENRQYDVSFIGTAHSNRPLIINKIINTYFSRDRVFLYYYLPHWIVFLYNKLFNRFYKGVRFSDIHFSPLSSDECFSVYSNSSYTIDISHPKQNGVPMRTLEAMKMGIKLITTDSSIKLYDFYNPQNICIVDAKNPVIMPSFFNSDFGPIKNEIMDYYSIDVFVKELLNAYSNQQSFCGDTL